MSTKWLGLPTHRKKMGLRTFNTVILGHLTPEQIDAYQEMFRIEEIADIFRFASTRKRPVTLILPSGNPEANPNYRRDPSPPPKYDSRGTRTNTREARTIEAMEKEQHYLVEVAVRDVLEYNPPVDYKKPEKNRDKLYIPLNEYPDINFVGLLLGPRGNTLRELQEKSGAKLAIRGKGLVKEGMRGDDSGNPENDDDLHVVITADTTQKIALAKKLTQEIVSKAIESPTGQNEFKRTQLRDLAILNGTLRETKPYVPEEQRPTRMDITKVVCKICKRVGHYARDCRAPRDGEGDESDSKRRRVDDEHSLPQPYTSGIIPPPLASAAAAPATPAVAPPPGLPIQPPPQTVRPPPPGLSLPVRPPPPSGAKPPPPGDTKPPPPGDARPPPPVDVKPPPPTEAKPPPPAVAKPPPPTDIKPPPPKAKPAPPPPQKPAPPPQ